LLAAVYAYARDLAENCSPASMATIKRQVYEHYALDLASAMADSNRLMEASLGKPDFLEGVKSFQERRHPRFAPLGG
ncbi:MAG: enoyl-CoA hydratase, partial [Candidatus Binatia bacterium]